MPNPHPQRSKPAQQPVFSSGNLSEIIFLTVCSKNRKPILASENVHTLLRSLWSAPDSHWSVGRYVIMPDHLHLFCSPKSLDSLSVHTWTTYWKSQATKSWPQPFQRSIWQRQIWDTQLRTHDSYAQKWEYVRHNPVRHALVTDPNDWPYQGELTTLPWHDR